MILKSYQIVCDDSTCVNATDHLDSKKNAIQNALEANWLKRGTKFYCSTCKNKPEYQPKKRGRKPKEDKQEEVVCPWAEPSENNSWSPPEA